MRINFANIYKVIQEIEDVVDQAEKAVEKAERIEQEVKVYQEIARNPLLKMLLNRRSRR